MRSTRWFQPLLHGAAALGIGSLMSCSGGGGGGGNQFLPTPAPTITSISPTSGSTGTAVTLVGTNLDTVTAVNFGATAAVIGARTATRLATTVPSGATTGTLSVTGPGVTAVSTTIFTVVPNLAPTAPLIVGPAGQLTGSSNTINWTNFIVAAQDPDGDDTTFALTSTPTSVVNHLEPRPGIRAVRGSSLGPCAPSRRTRGGSAPA